MDTSQDTLSALTELAHQNHLTTDEDSDEEIVDIGGKRRKIFRNTRSRSLSQPSDTSLQLQIEEGDEIKTMLNLMKKMSSQFTVFKKSITKDIKTIKDDLKEVKESVKEIKDKNIQISPDNINDSISIETISQRLAIMESKIDKIDDHIENKDTTPPKQSHKDLKQKVTLIKDIDDKINKRKKAFYDRHQLTDRIDIHKKWLAEDPPTIPASFIPKYIHKEPQREYEIRKKQKISELESKIQIWEFRAKEADDKVKFYDELVKQEIEGSEKDDTEKEREKKSWVDLVKIEEEKSINIWNKKRKEILDQPKRQIENKRIQTIENKLYSTVAKSAAPSSENNSRDGENDWQVVTYNNNRRKPKNQHNSHNYNSRNFHWHQRPYRQKWY